MINIIKKVFVLLIVLYISAFSQKRIIIFEADYSKNYMLYALNDLIKKNIFLYFDIDIIPNNFIKENNYKIIKSKIKELTINNNADISVLYDINPYKNGFAVNYVIFNKEKPREWLERNIYSKEDNLFEAINKILEDISYYSSISANIKNIKEDEYVPLIGYYSQKVNNIINDDRADDDKLYDVFFNFYKENIYFNMDYLEYLMIKCDNIKNINLTADNIYKYLGKNNHYSLYSLGCLYYAEYKVNAEAEDIDLSIKNYNKAAEIKKNNHIYYYKIADAYILKNDYENASKYYGMSINAYDKDIKIIKDAVYLLKRDMNKNGNIVIEYLKKIISINENDDEALEELAEIYNGLGDKYNAEIYYTKLFDAVNYNLYIINNIKPNAVLYDKYIKKRNDVKKILESFN